MNLQSDQRNQAITSASSRRMLSFVLHPSAFILALLLAPVLLSAATPTDTPSATATPTFSPSPTVTMTAVCNSTFGCVTCTASSGVGVAEDALVAAQFLLPSDGTVRSIFVYLTGTTGARIRAGIYSDSSNYPGTLLAQSPDQFTVEGWNEIFLSPIFLTGGQYWLVELSESDASIDRIVWHASPSGTKRQISLNFGYGSLPTTMPATSVVTSETLMAYASYCPGPPIFFTPTPTLTPSPTPVQFKAAPQGKLVVGPVPARKGEPVCLYFDQAPADSTWEVFNVRGQRVSSLTFNLGEQACWDTKGIAPGLYIVRAKVGYLSGGKGELTQKVVVVP